MEDPEDFFDSLFGVDAKDSAIDVEGEGATEHPEGAVHAEGNDDKTEPARISSGNPAPQTLHHKLSFL